ncbi:MAG TPA: OsmC family protein [Thermoanaerobaculia bacterium]|nr:OsmC family protein [Thermoanaerobaculia bacterium]
MPTRTASAVWEGDLKNGKGTMRMTAWEGPYSFASRFEQAGGTNPEELLAAAHAGCFSMAFSNGLAGAGHTPRRVTTTARVTLDKAPDGFRITTVELDCQASVPGIDPGKFQELAEGAKKGCPVSKLFTGAEIRLSAKLV